MSANTPDRQGMQIWEAYLHSHTGIMRVLERELQNAHALSLAEYDVLLHLRRATERRLRMGELASAVLFSTGGLSRLLDRLERTGLVVRERTPDDRRGVYAVLTEAGLARLREASETHLHGIQEHFVAALHDEEREPVARFLSRLVAVYNDTHEAESVTTDLSSSL
ncbi:MAG TPA: MarR family transcriptional regulator [Ktedonobacteraceae bacterium]|jgi:DNA-binding MarR family transcriptional regulator|nr:MarR family transcriptional regulator [Ktedonobacteraceae bacterium]